MFYILDEVHMRSVRSPAPRLIAVPKAAHVRTANLPLGQAESDKFAGFDVFRVVFDGCEMTAHAPAVSLSILESALRVVENKHAARRQSEVKHGLEWQTRVEYRVLSYRSL